MAVTFTAINWTPNELMGETKTQQLADNGEWLFRNTPRAMYTAGGLTRTEGTKIATGRVIITKPPRRRQDKDSATATVRFGNFFATRCEPIITTGIVSGSHTNIFATISGIGKLMPDHRGFNVGVNIAVKNKRKDKITRSFYVTWQAMGY